MVPFSAFPSPVILWCPPRLKIAVCHSETSVGENSAARPGLLSLRECQMLNDADALLFLRFVDRAMLFTLREEAAPNSPLQSARDHVSRLGGMAIERSVPDSILSSFNQVALIHLQCGSPEKAEVLCQMALRLCFVQYKKTKRAEWIVGAMQPAINLARLAAYRNDHEDPLELFARLYEFAKYGKDLRVGMVLFNRPVRGILERFAPGVFQAAINAYVVDSIKAYLSRAACERLTSHLDHLFAEQLQHSPVGLALHESKARAGLLGCDKSHTISDASYLWSVACQSGEHNPAILSILIDALIANNRHIDAEVTIQRMIDYADRYRGELSVSQQTRLAYSLAIRNLECGRSAPAELYLDQAQSYALIQADQRTLCRVAILRYVIASRYRECRRLLDRAFLEMDTAMNCCEFARENAMARYVMCAHSFTASAWEAFAKDAFIEHYNTLTRRPRGENSALGYVRRIDQHGSGNSRLPDLSGRPNPISHAYNLLTEIASSAGCSG